MKTKKRIISIALALMLVFSMSVSAFAAPAETTVYAEIRIVVPEYDFDEVFPIEIASGGSLYDAIMENFGSDDATYGDFMPEWIYSNDVFWPTVPAYFLNSFLGLESILVAYYPDLINGGWVSESYDWKYTVDGEYPVFSEDETPDGYTFVEDHQKAMNQYIIQEGDEIVMTYQFWVERWN